MAKNFNDFLNNLTPDKISILLSTKPTKVSKFLESKKMIEHV